MTSGVQIQVTGTDEVARRFFRLSRSADDLHGVFGEIAAEIASDAQRLVPRVTGRLAADIRPSSTRHGGGVTVTVPYGGVQEFGWRARNISPQPYLRPAADSKADSAADEIGTEIQRKIDQAGLG